DQKAPHEKEADLPVDGCAHPNAIRHPATQTFSRVPARSSAILPEHTASPLDVRSVQKSFRTPQSKASPGGGSNDWIAQRTRPAPQSLQSAPYQIPGPIDARAKRIAANWAGVGAKG